MQKSNWDTNRIKDGFNKFVEINNRLPTALEVDAADYLPSSRHIQRELGGLKNLRAVLGYEDRNFGSGQHRSNIAHRVNQRGRQSELELEKKLCDIFGEVFVHTEKIFNNTKTRVDFYIYTPSGNFGADIIYPENMRTLQSNLNIKSKKYDGFTEALFYVIANTGIKQSALDLYNENKKISLLDNEKLVTVAEFIKIIETMGKYSDPLSNKS